MTGIGFEGDIFILNREDLVFDLPKRGVNIFKYMNIIMISISFFGENYKSH
jgi:hypothetical protein